MKAAILTKINAPLIIADLVMPTNLQYGQVLVRVLTSGICGAQLQEIAGYKGNADHLPHLLGHEGCGIVDSVGSGVTRVRPGQKVVMHWRKASGIEAAFPSYELAGKQARSKSYQANGVTVTLTGGGKRKTVGGGKVTTLSEYSVASENRLTPVPFDTDPDLCALLGCGLSTALGTVESEAKVKQGERVLIVGAGGLGCNLIRCCSMVNADITAMDIHKGKERLVKSLGARHYINASEIKPFGCYDVIIDTAGNGGSMDTTLSLLAPSGRFIMVGQPRPGKTVHMLCANHMFEGEGKTIKATQGGGFRPDLDVPRYLRMYDAGALSIKGIITRRMPLRRINDALALVRQGQASRVIIDMSLK